MSKNNNQVTNQANIDNQANTVTIINDIKEMLNQLQSLTDDHFELNPDYITNEEIIELLRINKLISRALKKAGGLS